MLRNGRGTLALFFWLGLYLLVLSYSAGAQVTPSSTSPSSSIEPSEQPTTLSWQDLEALSAELSNKANDLVPRVVDLNSQLGQLQSSLTLSTTLLAQSLDLRKQEDQKAQAAVKAALNRSAWFQRGLFVVAGGFAGYLIKGWEGAAYGAGAGVLSDAALEIALSIKIKL